MKFIDMNISAPIIEALENSGIESPTEIQQVCIEKMQASETEHLLGQAQTGSGKTLAYAIPIMENFRPTNKHVQAIVLVPTRELCKQVSTVFRTLSEFKQANIVEVYGGVSIRRQIKELRRDGQIVIATPGRLIDLYNRRQIGFRFVKYVAIDEADRMLDMGFMPDMEIILLEAMKDCKPQLMLFSATLQEEIKSLVENFSKGGSITEINISKDNLVVDNCKQYSYNVSKNKYRDFLRILKHENPKYSIIFAKTKQKTEDIAKRLQEEQDLGLRIGFLNGDLSQAQREDVLQQFRSKRINCLIGTNVLARGLDFPRVSHVFNYDLPRDPEIYVHRIGRTSRVFGTDKDVSVGTAISIVNNQDKRLLKRIEKLTNVPIERLKLPKKGRSLISTSPKDVGFDIESIKSLAIDSMPQVSMDNGNSRNEDQSDQKKNTQTPVQNQNNQQKQKVEDDDIPPWERETQSENDQPKKKRKSLKKNSQSQDNHSNEDRPRRPRQEGGSDGRPPRDRDFKSRGNHSNEDRPRRPRREGSSESRPPRDRDFKSRGNHSNEDRPRRPRREGSSEGRPPRDRDFKSRGNHSNEDRPRRPRREGSSEGRPPRDRDFKSRGNHSNEDRPRRPRREGSSEGRPPRDRDFKSRGNHSNEDRPRRPRREGSSEGRPPRDRDFKSRGNHSNEDRPRRPPTGRWF